MIECLTVGPIGECCYFLPLDGSDACIIVDPGDEAARIVDLLAGRRPAAIALTHGHLDHTAAIPALMKAFAAKGLTPPIAIHGADASYLGSGSEDKNRALFAAIRSLGFFKHYYEPMPEASLLLEDGDFLLGSAWKVIHTPGHTLGSVCFYNVGLDALVAGDTLFRDGVGRTDGPDSDSALLALSLERKLFLLPDATAVYPGHGEPTSIGREKRHFG